MEKITKDILKNINNEKTKVMKKEDFSGNYYSYIMDTIYLSGRNINKKKPRNAANISDKSANLILLCHECIHSVQKKYMHILNTIFSNISLVLAILFIILKLFSKDILVLKYITLVVIIASIIIRAILEIGAINGSMKLARECINKGITTDIKVTEIEEASKYIEKNRVFAVIQMILNKLILLFIILVL